MSAFARVLLAAGLALAASLSFAQPAASAPAGPGPMMGGRMGGGPMGAMRGYHWSDQTSPGWSMMTPQERQAHRARMASFKTYGDCRAYLDEHHQAMVARAQARGRTMPAAPPYDPCNGLPGAPK